MADSRLCARCKRPLTRGRLAAGKRCCWPCECARKREGKQRAHDRRIESEDFTSDDYWRLHEVQGGRCAIHGCRAQGKSKALAVEHDHKCDRGHDPARWCRECVRGLTCAMHNEWIGRAGDNPDVFDSLAEYLRQPPAREVMMDPSAAFRGTGADTANFLREQYRIPKAWITRMLDQARMVGKRPWLTPGGTSITVRYIREPRSQEGLYEIAEQAPQVDRDVALKQLKDEMGLTDRRAKSALNKAWEEGRSRVATKAGVIRIQYHGRDSDGGYLFSIERTEA